MALIRLTGKYAVGDHAFAIVDDDMVEFLSQWRWKAKPNGKGNNIYAVRNTYIDGKCVTIRMHRVVAQMGRDNPLEVDHDNHNSLDKRRTNLIPATRSANALNAKPITQTGKCKHCDVPMERVISSCARGNSMACSTCRAALKVASRKAWLAARREPGGPPAAKSGLSKCLGPSP